MKSETIKPGVDLKKINPSPTRTLKKVSAAEIKLSDKPVGFEFDGKFVGISQKAHQALDKESGEVVEKTLHMMIVEASNGERTKFLADAGLRGALEDCLIQPGDWFKAVKGAKRDIGGGRTMNQWDIFQYAEEN